MRILRWKVIMDYLGEINIIIRGLISRRQACQSQRKTQDDRSGDPSDGM